MPEIRPATKDNWKELIRLKVRVDQTHFVASNLYSIAEAQFGDDYEGHWDLHPFGIYDGTEERIQAVGISYEPENEAARKLYASLGFEETGEVVGGEVVAMLPLR